ncbi:hypothetical protein GYT97_03875 [Lactobacillus mellis]|uniref:hypothetical protein n=1 Tax=Bombilactobacillus mellis TaxID=1218508 RepID=UPI00157FD003|nr:hypothetical protein [Bombilactobacillus mellis]NUG39018.1 hypothetical protein [Bombilactobacillus mellis]
MKTRFIIFVIDLLMFATLVGCSNNQENNNDSSKIDGSTIISKVQMKHYYKNIFDSYADVLDSYGDSIIDNKLETKASATHTIKLIDNINIKLKNNSINKEESNNFIKLNLGLKNLVECYKTNNFSNSKEYNSKINEYLPKVERDLSVDRNNKVVKATNRLNEIVTNRSNIIN